VNNEQLTFISTAGFQSYVHLWCSRPASHTVRGGSDQTLQGGVRIGSSLAISRGSS